MANEVLIITRNDNSIYVEIVSPEGKVKFTRSYATARIMEDKVAEMADKLLFDGNKVTIKNEGQAEEPISDNPGNDKTATANPPQEPELSQEPEDLDNPEETVSPSEF